MGRYQLQMPPLRHKQKQLRAGFQVSVKSCTLEHTENEKSISWRRWSQRLGQRQEEKQDFPYQIPATGETNNVAHSNLPPLASKSFLLNSVSNQKCSHRIKANTKSRKCKYKQRHKGCSFSRRAAPPRRSPGLSRKVTHSLLSLLQDDVFWL